MGLASEASKPKLAIDKIGGQLQNAFLDIKLGVTADFVVQNM